MPSADTQFWGFRDDCEEVIFGSLGRAKERLLLVAENKAVVDREVWASRQFAKSADFCRFRRHRSDMPRIFCLRCVTRSFDSELRTAIEYAAGSPTMKTFFLPRVIAV